MKAASISLSLDAAGIEAKHDASAKRILSYKAVLAWILKLNTAEFRDYDVDYIASHSIGEVSVSEKAVDQDMLDGNARVEAMNSESSSVREGTIYYDIRFRAFLPRDEGDLGIFVNLEVQNKDRAKYSLVTRGIYYVARMISEQRGTVFTNMDYHKIRKVYSIWICPDSTVAKGECSIMRCLMYKEDILGKSFINRRDYDKMEVVVIRLGDDAVYSAESITGLLSALFSPGMELEERKRILDEVYGIPMSEELEGEMTNMCNLSSAIREDALNEGLKEGRKEGRKEGFLMSLFQLVDRKLLSIDNAAQTAGLTVDAFLEKKREFGD